MAVTTKILFPATSNSSTTDFSLSGLQLHNQDDLDVYVTKTTAGIAANNNKRILHFRQSTNSNVDANHNQVNNTDGLYFPAITHTGGTETLENYQIVNNNGTVRFNNALPSGAIVFVERRTRDESGTYTAFASGSTIRARDLNDSAEQSNFTAQEARNKSLTIEGVLFDGDQPNENFVKTKHIVDDTITTAKIVDANVTTAKIANDAVTVDKLANNSVVAGNIQNGQVGSVALATNAVTTDKILNDSVTTAKIPNNAILNAKIADDQIDSRHYVDGSIDTAHLGNNAVTTNKITDDSVTTAKIPNDAITTAKIADSNVTTAKLANDAVTVDKLANNSVVAGNIQNGAVGSLALATNAVTTAKITNSNVTADKIADGNVTTTKLATNAVTTAKITDANVTTAKIADSNVTTAKIANDAVTVDKLANNAVVAGNIQNGAVNSLALATNAVTTDKITDANVTTAKLANNAINNAKLADNSVSTSNIVANAVTDGKIAAGAVTENKIQSNSVTTAKIANANVTTAKIANDAVTIDKIADAAIVTNSEQASHSVNDTTFFTTAAAEARYFNASTGETIKDGQTFPDNDTTIATTAAINDRIIDLVEEVGGFVPIANETSFPTSNPDINNGSGTLVSIKSISSTRTPSSGTVTIANGAGTGNTVSITGCGSTVLTAGFGIIVETTSTLHTYAFHRLVPKATEVTTVASNITNIVNAGSNTANINAVAGNATNINTVAGNNSNITAVANNSSNINSAVSNASNINSAVSNASNINTVAGSISNVNTAATNISSINTAASNITNVNNFTDRYQIASSNPTTDGGGNALAAGDLYFNTSANELKVYTGSAWQGGVTATGNFASVTGNTFTGSNIYNDNVKAIFGTGSDFQIYHNGSHTFLENSTGHVCFRAGGGQIQLQAVNGENGVLIRPDGAVEIKYDNSKKFETVTGGVTITGTLTNDGIRTGDLEQICAGNSCDISIYHDSNGSINGTAGSSYIKCQGTHDNILNIFTSSATGKIHLKNNNLNKTMLSANGNGSVDLYHNNTKRFETTGNGVNVIGNLIADCNVSIDPDSNTNHFITGAIQDGSGWSAQGIAFGQGTGKMAAFGVSNSLYMAHGDGSNANSLTTFMEVNNAGRVKLHYNGSGKFETTSTGATITGTLIADGLTLYDNEKLLIGTNTDIEVFHDGTNSIFQSDTGDLQINSGNSAGNVEINLNNNVAGNTRETSAKFVKNGTVELYYDNNKKLETTSSGVTVSGRLNAGTAGGQTPNSTNWATNSAINLLGSYGGGLAFNDNGNNGFVQYVESSGTIFNLKAGAVGGSTEQVIRAVKDGQVELYHNNVKMLETNIPSGHNGEVILGQKVKIRHTGSGNGQIFPVSGNMYLNAKEGETSLVAMADAGVHLYYDNSEKFKTTSVGVQINGDLNFSDSAANDIHLRGGKIYGDDSALPAFTIQNTTGNANHSKIVIGDNFGSDNGGITFYGAGSSSTDVKLRIRGTTDTVEISDNHKFVCGDGSDLQIYHDGSDSYLDNSTGNLNLRVASNENGIRLTPNGSVNLYYNNSQKLNTANSGVEVSGNLTASNVLLSSSTSVLRWPQNAGSNTSRTWDMIGEQGGYGFLEVKYASAYNGSADEKSIRFNANAGVFLYYDNAKKFETRSGGCHVTGHLELDDNGKVMLGASNDMQIFHDGSNSRISDNGTGNLILDGNNIIIESNDNTETQAYFASNGSVKLYCDNSEKFRTTSTGAIVYNDLGIGTAVGNSLGNNRTYAIAIGDNDTGMAQNGDGILEFWSNNQVKQTIAQGGNGHRVMFNHSDTGTYNAHVSSRQNSSGPYPFGAIGQSTNQGFFGFFNSGGSLVGNIAKSGNSTQYNTSSDYRLKEDDTVISDGITRLKQLRPIRFKWKEFPEKGHQDGFFAHEVSSVVPEAVNGEKDAVITQEYIDSGKEVQNNLGKPLIQFLDNSKLVPLITAALRDAVAKIETLETKVAALEAA